MRKDRPPRPERRARRQRSAERQVAERRGDRDGRPRRAFPGPRGGDRRASRRPPAGRRARRRTRSTLRRAPGASPSMRPSRLSITVSIPRFRLVTRTTPSVTLRPPSGANRSIDSAAPTGSRLPAKGAWSRSSVIVGAVRETRAGVDPAEQESDQGQVDHGLRARRRRSRPEVVARAARRRAEGSARERR